MGRGPVPPLLLLLVLAIFWDGWNSEDSEKSKFSPKLLGCYEDVKGGGFIYLFNNFFSLTSSFKVLNSLYSFDQGCL